MGYFKNDIFDTRTLTFFLTNLTRIHVFLLDQIRTHVYNKIIRRNISMTGKDLLKLLLKDGWEVDRIKGSHHQMKKGNQLITIPVHNKDLATGLLNQILKQAGLK